jgi:hypothetical protein
VVEFERRDSFVPHTHLLRHGAADMIELWESFPSDMLQVSADLLRSNRRYSAPTATITRESTRTRPLLRQLYPMALVTQLHPLFEPLLLHNLLHLRAGLAVQVNSLQLLPSRISDD